MYERSNDPLISHQAFCVRMMKHIGIGVAFILGSLLVGILGYHYIGDLPWLDAFVDASMILSGMGPVSPLKNEAIKIFAGIYAIYCGLLFVSIIALILLPFLHRMLHKFHISSKKD